VCSSDLPELMLAAGRISEFFRKKGQHRFDNPRIHGRGGLIIQIDRELH
jgi:hypothetical protein